MHELSIAMSIAELAVEEAHKHDATSVIRVDVEIGTLSGVETEALEFAWDVAIQGTAAEKASLRIISVPAEAMCLDYEQTRLGAGEKMHESMDENRCSIDARRMSVHELRTALREI